MMIDFHTHILPEMDDGSRSIDESIEMLRLSNKMGIDTMISTSHFYPDAETVDDYLKRRNEKYEMLKQATKGISDVPSIVIGAEVAFYSGMSREKEISKLCISDTNYMLIEMPFSEWSSLTIKEIKSLISNRGIIPIIAHIERYLPYQRRSGKLEELLDLGVIIQTNGESVIETKQRRHILKMIEKNKVHLLGSDCHNMSERPPNLDLALDIISKKVGNTALKRIDSNGRIILNSDIIR